MLISRKSLVLVLASAFLFGGVADSHANRARSAKPRAQRAKKPAERGRQAARKPTNRVKRQATAKVAFKSEFKGKRISDKAIVAAVRKGFSEYLNEPKGGMHQTRGEWNRMDPKSVKVKSVTIEKSKSTNLGWTLEKGERMFTAIVEVKAIENGKPITVTAQVRSVMHLSPTLPRFYLGRVQGTPELKAEDMRHLGNPSTVGWID